MNDEHDAVTGGATGGPTGSDDETRIVPTDSERPEQLEQPEQLAQRFSYEEPEPTLIPEPAPPRPGGSHPVNVGQLAMGLVFLVAVGVWALIQTDTVTGDDIRWLLPLPWVIGGGIGLFAAAISSVRRHGSAR